MKDVFAGFFIMTDNIRFAAGSFHFIERPEFVRIGLQPRLYSGPFKAFVADFVVLEASSQYAEKFITLSL
jgi:hypothetical protein